MAAPKQLWSVAFTASPDHAAALSAALEDDAVALTVLAPPRTGKAQIEALYDHEPDKAALNARIAVIALVNKIKPPALVIKQAPKLDWLKKVAEDFPPFPVARWLIHGAMYRKQAEGHRHALQIDATSAFGTGEHPTTRGCLIALDRLLKKESPRHMLDMGCGTGILAMAFAQGRAGKAVAVDLDRDSLTIAKDNARANGLQKRMRVGWSHGYKARLVRGRYDLIMANIFAGPLSMMAKDLKRHLRPGSTAILAGLLTPQANRVLSAHRAQKIFLTRRWRIGEWTILALKRPERAK